MGEGNERSGDSAFCILCEKQVRLLTLGETERGYGLDRDEVVRRGQKSTIHWLHNSRGQIRVCSGSLREKRPRRIRGTEEVILRPCTGITGRL
jgi:hypothetical protein